ncbi:MAG: peptidyl-prolyl cis-trans isomerase [Planctomycetia bacterium]|nr:peptidyl-prolyl cis-trans isomerase [Planctomycetia bacterium]
MNALYKGLTCATVMTLAMVATCANAAQNAKPDARQAASRVAHNVAQENPIRQNATRVYPEIVAEVNGEQITLQQLQTESLRAHGQDVLSRILNRALVLAECKRQNLVITRADVDAEIERLAKSFRLTRSQYLDVVEKDSSMSYQEYAEEVVWPRLALQALVADKIKLTDEELEAAYLKSYGPSVALQMIVCQTKEEADNIYKRVTEEGEDFGQIAKDESLDVATASNKGRMQPIFHGTLADVNLETILFALEPGQLTDVIGPYGPQDQFVLFRCENKYDPVVPEDRIEEVKDRIQVQASAAKLKSAANELFERLGREANVVNVIGDPELSKQYPNVAAMIDGKPIWLDAVVEMSMKLYAQQDLNALISITLIRQECKKVGVTVSDQDVATDIWIRAAESTLPTPEGPNVKEYMRSELAKYNVTEEYYKNSIVWPGVALKKLSEGLVKVTDEDVQKSFEANFGPSVQCLGIVLNEERRAREVWQKARAAANSSERPFEDVFGDLAAEYSIEPDGKQMHGRIPPIVKNGGYPQLEEEAFALKPGEMSQIIQVDGSTFVILYCQEIIPARDVTLEQVRDQIVSQLRKMREATAAGEFYASVVNRSTVVDNLTHQVVSPKQQGSPDALMAAPQSDAQRR